MISCNECKERFKSWGDDPIVKSGRYHLSGCDYCDKPQYNHDLEQSYESRPQTIWKTRPIDNEIDQLKGQVIYLQNKLNSHLDKKNNRDKI